MFETKVMIGMCRPGKGKVMGECGNIFRKELQHLCFPLYIVRKDG
jgi:hypothetical protein